MRTKIRSKFSLLLIALAAMIAIPAAIAVASSVTASAVDVNVPEKSVTLAQGGSEDIDINISVTGQQAGTATFKVYKDWTLSGGTFTGSNPQTFTVDSRNAQDAADTFSTTGKVSVDADEADGGPYALKINAFDITNSNSTGAKLAAGTGDSYSVTVDTPEAPADTTAPTITLNTPADNAIYTKGEQVQADFSCADEEGGSGLASCDGSVADDALIDTSTVGEHTFTVNAADNAGNTAEVEHTYYVHYAFNGFRSPVDNLPTLNTVKAGSSVPVKFSLTGNQGLNIFASDENGSYPRSVQVPCDAAPTDAIEQTVTAGGSQLSYDASTDQYNYVWKTEKGWAGTCRQLVVKLDDGTYHQANFKLTK